MVSIDFVQAPPSRGLHFFSYNLTSNAGLSPTTFKLLLLVCLGIAGLYLFIISRSHAQISVETLTMSVTLKHLKIAPKDAHTATIIFLHGLGDTGHGWLPVAKQLWSQFPNAKWILPHAPEIPITINGGMLCPGWFDLSTLDKLTNSEHDDEKGMMRTLKAVDALIQAEVDAGIPENRIIVGGFSQGGAMSILTGLSGKRKLGGVIALSTWIPLNHKIKEMVNPSARDIPVFWGHGKSDGVVQYQFGERSVDVLHRQLGFPMVPAGKTFARPGVRFESYPGMAHSACPEEIAHMSAWLQEALKQ